MSSKNIRLKSHKVESLDEKKIRSSQHSKIKKSMADQLRGEIDTLLQKQHKAKDERRRCYEDYEMLKAEGEEKDA